MIKLINIQAPKFADSEADQPSTSTDDSTNSTDEIKFTKSGDNIKSRKSADDIKSIKSADDINSNKSNDDIKSNKSYCVINPTKSADQPSTSTEKIKSTKPAKEIKSVQAYPSKSVIKVTQCADGVTDQAFKFEQYLIPEVEIKLTNSSVSDLHSSSAAKIKGTKSATGCLGQSIQFGSIYIRLRKPVRTVNVVSTPASQSVSKIKVFS